MENITTITALVFISLATAIGVIVWRYATYMYAHLEARSRAREALEAQTTKDIPMVDKQEDDGQAHEVFHECGVAYRIPVRSQTQLRRSE